MTRDEFWSRPGLVRVAALFVGAVQGLAIHFVRVGNWASPDGGAPTLLRLVNESLETFLFVAPVLFLLTATRDSLRQAAVTAAGVAAVLGLIEGGLRAHLGDVQYSAGDLSFGLVVSGLWVTYAASVYFPAWRDSGRFPPPYENLFTQAWNNLIYAGLAGAFTIASWAALALSAELFSIINLNFLKDLMDEHWFQWTFSLSAFSFGLVFGFEWSKVIFATRTLVLGLLAILAVILSAVGTIFLLSLPFTGLQPLWDTGRAAPILIALSVLLSLGAVALTREGGAEGGLKSWLNYVVMAGLVTSTVLLVIASYALWLRIDQYGLTPDRYYGLAGALAAAVFAVPLSVGVIRYRGEWQKGLVKAKSLIGLGTVVIAVIVHVPFIDAYSLSAASQAARLTDGRVSADNFDFGYLKFSLGRPGHNALEAIRNDESLADRDKVDAKLAAVDSLQTPYGSLTDKTEQTDERLADFATYMTLYVDDSSTLAEARSYLLVHQRAFLSGCWSSYAMSQVDGRGGNDIATFNCVMISRDIDGDARDDLLLFSMVNSQSATVILRAPDGSGWRNAGELAVNDSTNAFVLNKETPPAISVAPSELPDVIINGVRYH